MWIFRLVELQCILKPKSCWLEDNLDFRTVSNVTVPCIYHLSANPPTHQPHMSLQERKLSPLERGGTLKGAAAAGKDASEKFKSLVAGEAETTGPVMQVRAARKRSG